AAAPRCGHEARGRGCGCLWARGTAGRTGLALRLGGEARKGGGLTAALGPGWAWGLRGGRTPGGEGAGPRPLEHEAQPDECEQRELVEKQMRDHGTTPSYTCCNENIVPGVSGYGISRRLRVHDPVGQHRKDRLARGALNTPDGEPAQSNPSIMGVAGQTPTTGAGRFMGELKAQ